MPSKLWPEGSELVVMNEWREITSQVHLAVLERVQLNRSGTEELGIQSHHNKVNHCFFS